MDQFKLTAWNIEWADRLETARTSSSASTLARTDARLDAIAQQIVALDADIMMIGEGPRTEARAASFFARVAPQYRLITRGDDAAYGLRGSQWLWFLVRASAPITASLVHLDRWRALTTQSSGGAHQDGRWEVSYPVFDAALTRLDFVVPKRHEHYRHPQVLLAEIDGQRLEIIGCHLKSKINSVRPSGDPHDPAFFEKNPALVADVIQSRIKLTTECSDIRHYIEARFDEQPDVPIILCGDLNDGPGKERIEQRFLYHDLVSSLQGEVFFAQRFLNHALFDFAQGARWSYDLKRDRLDPGRNPRILLDHIMFTQGLTGPERPGAFPFRARRGGGLVEHEVHHAIAAGRPAHAETSDHRPVSMSFERRTPPA